MLPKKIKNIVIIGGGTGTYTLLLGLRQFPVNNTVIVSTADDGGSTGRLREQLDIVPVGDLRQCLIGLSQGEPLLEKLLSYRFAKGDLRGHNAGNIILAALLKISGDVERTIGAVAKLLNIKGQILPVTLKPAILSATLENGKKIIGEHNIDEFPYDSLPERPPIKKLMLSPSNIKANPRAVKAIKKADAIIFGPGDLFTSTLPNLLVRDIARAVVSSRAKKILVANLMTKAGQTSGFKASDFVTVLEKYLRSGKKRARVGALIVNTKKPGTSVLRKYKKEQAGLVAADLGSLRKKPGLQILDGDFITEGEYKKKRSDTLKRSWLRHDSMKLAMAIYKLLS